MESRDRIEAVRRMEECIGKHLTEPITLRMLADVAGYSPWHSARLFKEMTGQTPFEYIRAARLLQAAVSLRGGDVKVVDVAFDFVLDSHEGFTRAFSRQFGMTPRDYCRTAAPVPLFMPPVSRITTSSCRTEVRTCPERQRQRRFLCRWWNGRPVGSF